MINQILKKKRQQTTAIVDFEAAVAYQAHTIKNVCKVRSQSFDVWVYIILIMNASDPSRGCQCIEALFQKI